MLQEVVLQRGFVRGQVALGPVPAEASEPREASLEVVVEVALDGAAGHAGRGGDLVMLEAVALQPEDLHLALDVRVRVVVAVGGDRPEVFLREGELAHRRRPWCRLHLLPRCRLWRFSSAAQTCQRSPRPIEHYPPDVARR